MTRKVIDTVRTSNHLNQLFMERGLTPKEIQKQLRLQSIQAVYKWMNPRYKTIPSLDHLIQLAYILGCSLEDLLVIKEVDIFG